VSGTAGQAETNISIAQPPRLEIVSQERAEQHLPARVKLLSTRTGITLEVEEQFGELVLSLFFPDSYLETLTQDQIARMQSSAPSELQGTNGRMLRLPVPLSTPWQPYKSNSRSSPGNG
jgi:hypothetical protein